MEVTITKHFTNIPNASKLNQHSYMISYTSKLNVHNIVEVNARR